MYTYNIFTYTYKFKYAYTYIFKYVHVYTYIHICIYRLIHASDTTHSRVTWPIHLCAINVTVLH